MKYFFPPSHIRSTSTNISLAPLSTCNQQPAINDTNLSSANKSAIGVSEAKSKIAQEKERTLFDVVNCRRDDTLKPQTIVSLPIRYKQIALNSHTNHKKKHQPTPKPKQTMTIVPKTSRGLRVLPPPKKEDIKAEKDDLLKEIALIEQWWREPRWKGTTRTFTG